MRQALLANRIWRLVGPPRPAAGPWSAGVARWRRRAKGSAAGPQRGVKPGSGKPPLPAHLRLGQVQRFSDLGVFEAGEVAQFHDLRLLGALEGEPFQGLVEGQDSFVRVLGGEGDVVEVDPFEAAAVTFPGPFSGAIDKDPAHRFGRGPEEMAAAIPLGLGRRVAGADQTEPGFVDEGRGLESLTGRFLGEAGGGQFSQLLIDQREKFFRRASVAVLDPAQQDRDVAHRRKRVGCNPRRLCFATTRLADRAPALKPHFL